MNDLTENDLLSTIFPLAALPLSYYGIHVNFRTYDNDRDHLKNFVPSIRRQMKMAHVGLHFDLRLVLYLLLFFKYTNCGITSPYH